ncbi:Mitochondrial transcription termination factor family protein [Zostera marina]|uniref:Mitochondrial transcription termination factor family protein n=1 Tax=Zostera marina TaxID=29655 RepID=A0A0K9Q5N7_ZOSMR|nr:Mitochondrial transcription termination factor family protein [Zostera marina]
MDSRGIGGGGGNEGSGGISGFLKQKGFDREIREKMLTKCKRLNDVHPDIAGENWTYLGTNVGIPKRKLPHMIQKCPKLLTLSLHEKLIPMVQCLLTLGTKSNEVTQAIIRFPHILSHSVEEKLCPLLAFLQAIGVPEKQVGKLILTNPRLVSYSIDTKLAVVVRFLGDELGLREQEGMVGKVIAKHPSLMGYSVARRLQPTAEYLKSVVGLSVTDLQKLVLNHPEVLCRDVTKVLGPNVEFLRESGFGRAEMTAVVAGYPPVLIKSVRNSLEPRMRFLVKVMERGVDEVVAYPEFFKHGLKKRLELRHKALKEINVVCSLSDMLDCNRGKFNVKFGVH